MARNLCRSSCCDVVAHLGDMRGKPVEFRRYADGQVFIGVRWNCPRCDTAYFLFWRDTSDDAYGQPYRPRFTLDLSYYESFNDEHGDPDHVGCLCLDDAEDIQWVW